MPESPTPPLYKFRAYDTDDRRERVRRMLVAGEVYFARPPAFNDPFEARPHFVRADEDIETWRKSLFKWGLTMTKGSPTERLEFAERLARNADPELREFRDRQRADLAQRTAIYSMAAVRDDPLLWAHYARDHTGLCVHIDHTRPPFGAAMAVKYSETYPQIEIPRRHSQLETFERCILTKADSWKYEHEYRLCRIEFAPQPSRDLAMQWTGLVATAPVDRFTGITLGVRMPEPHRIELIEIAKARQQPLEVWQAAIHETKYQVTFERVA
jgi:hypothetical protein